MGCGAVWCGVVWSSYGLIQMCILIYNIEREARLRSLAIDLWLGGHPWPWPTLAATTSKLIAELETDWPVSFLLLL